ncbi:MAG: hypothetical protein ACREOF_17300 [Gemmatimonadales bacterium]
MRLSRVPSRAGLILTAALFGGACAATELPLATTEDEASLLQAHAPSHRPAPAAALPAQIPDPGISYTGLDASAADGTNGSLHLQVDASGEIPRFADQFISSVAVFGYAWADLDTGNGIVAVIHPTIGRDSRQNPDGWHTHPVQLGAGTKPSGSSDFCIVAIRRSQGGISIHEDVLRLNMAERWAGLPAGSLDVAASFIVQADAGCASGLGVAVIDTAAL